MSVDVPSRRERRVVLGGGLLIAATLVSAYGLAPLARAWRARTEAIAQLEQRRAMLRGLEARRPALEAAADSIEQQLAAAPRRVMQARSATLAASAAQALLQDAADAQHLVVTRLAVEPDSVMDRGATGPSMPATISVYGDITGVAGFLDVLSAGPRVVRVERVSMQRNAALAGGPDVVQLTVALRLPLRIE